MTTMTSRRSELNGFLAMSFRTLADRCQGETDEAQSNPALSEENVLEGVMGKSSCDDRH